MKDGDSFLQELDATNKDEILFFTNHHNVYKTKAYDLPDCKASSIGEYLENLLEMQQGEKAVYMAVPKDYSGLIVFAFENGKMAKVGISEYATKTNRRKLINAYSDRSPLVAMMHLHGDVDLFLQRGSDKALVVCSSLLPQTGTKSSGGITVFTMKKNSCLTIAREASEDDDKDYFRADKIPSTGLLLRKQLEIGE